MIDRRAFTTMVCGSILAAPLVAEGQQAPKIARIGYLNPSTPAAVVQNLEAFRQGMRELDHVEGKTFVLELRYAEAKPEREAAQVLGIPFAEVTQACLIPVVYTHGTDFKPGWREPLSTTVHWDTW